MVDSITSFFQLPSPGSISSAQRQETQPTVLDLGSDNLTYNAARQVATSVFAHSGGPFADINSFLTVAQNQIDQQSSGPGFNPRDFELGSQKYGSAQDLFYKRETSAEARLLELLKKPPKEQGTAPAPQPVEEETEAATADNTRYFDISRFGQFTSNNLPKITANAGATVTEGASTIITTAQLSASDTESAAEDITYEVTQGPSGGYLAFSDDPAAEITSFTQADLEAGRVTYIHQGGENPSDSFGFRVSDGNISLAQRTFDISVTPVDDAPVLETNAGGTVPYLGTTTITSAQLNVTDVDTSSDGITYEISDVRRGRVELSTNPGVAVTSFTQEDLDAGRVQFVHTGFFAFLQPSFNFSVNDGTTTLPTESFTFNVA